MDVLKKINIYIKNVKSHVDQKLVKMNYTVVSTVAENLTSLFPLAVGSSLNNESNCLKIKFTVERNNVFHGSCTLCFFFGLQIIRLIFKPCQQQKV